MKKIIFAVLLLAGCKQEGLDGYKFEREQILQTNFTTHVTLAQNEAQIRAVLKEVSPSTPNTKDTAAFAVVRNGNCQMFIVDPRVKYRPEIIGHEFTHCIFGDWHPGAHK